MSINKIILIGNLGKDTEFKQLENGCVANTTLATTDRAYTTQNGTQVPEQTEWHNLVFRGKLAEVARDWCKKGTKVYVEGKVRHRKYTDKQGIDRLSYEVMVDKLELLGSKQEEGQKSDPKPAQSTQQVGNTVYPNNMQDDGLPF